MEKVDIIVNPKYSPDIDKWSLLVVDRFNGGTHKNYNILYNSECEKQWFWSKEEALKFWNDVKKEML